MSRKSPLPFDNGDPAFAASCRCHPTRRLGDFSVGIEILVSIIVDDVYTMESFFANSVIQGQP